jgi:hypothetical protein
MMFGVVMRRKDVDAQTDTELGGPGKPGDRPPKRCSYDATRLSNNVPQNAGFLTLHVPALNRPFAVLFEQQCSDESQNGIFVGEDANDVAAPGIHKVIRRGIIPLSIWRCLHVEVVPYKCNYRQSRSENGQCDTIASAADRSLAVRDPMWADPLLFSEWGPSATSAEAQSNAVPRRPSTSQRHQYSHWARCRGAFFRPS